MQSDESFDELIDWFWFWKGWKCSVCWTNKWSILNCDCKKKKTSFWFLYVKNLDSHKVEFSGSEAIELVAKHCSKGDKRVSHVSGF